MSKCETCGKGELFCSCPSPMEKVMDTKEWLARHDNELNRQANMIKELKLELKGLRDQIALLNVGKSPAEAAFDTKGKEILARVEWGQ